MSRAQRSGLIGNSSPYHSLKCTFDAAVAANSDFSKPELEQLIGRGEVVIIGRNLDSVQDSLPIQIGHLIAGADRRKFDMKNNKIVAVYNDFEIGKVGVISLSEAIKPRPRTDIYHDVRIHWPSLISAADRIGYTISLSPRRSASNQRRGKKIFSNRELKELEDEFRKYMKSMQQKHGVYPPRHEVEKWASAKEISRDTVRNWVAVHELSEPRGRRRGNRPKP